MLHKGELLIERWLISQVRRVSLRWPPRLRTKRKAWVRRGVYLCAGYNCDAHEVPKSVKLEDGKRVENVHVDHKDPVGSFKDWNTYIERLFCSEDNLQILCLECHKEKTQDEKTRS